MAKKDKPLSEYDEKDIARYRHQFVVATLRRSSYRWPWRSFATNRARVGWGLFKCELCDGLIEAKEKKLDHIAPVVNPLTGFTTFDEFIDRLLIGAEGFQVICVWCHDEKTKVENEQRKATRARNKK